MATTMYFSKTISDKKKKDQQINLEFGRSSFYGGENLMYLTIDGKHVVIDEKTGREIFEAMDNLGNYLSYHKAP